MTRKEELIRQILDLHPQTVVGQFLTALSVTNLINIRDDLRVKRS